MIELNNEDCIVMLNRNDIKNPCIVTDPPFNIGYHYKTYKDKEAE